jgi:hypothetical protein
MKRAIILLGLILTFFSSALVWATIDRKDLYKVAKTEEYAMFAYWTNQGKKNNFIHLRMPNKSEEKIPVADSSWSWVLLDKINSMSEEGWEVVTMDSQSFSDSHQNITDQDEAHIMILLRRKVSQ